MHFAVHLRYNGVMKKQRSVKIATSFRLSQTAHFLMRRLAKQLGVSHGAVLELAIRKLDDAQAAQRREGKMLEAK